MCWVRLQRRTYEINFKNFILKDLTIWTKWIYIIMDSFYNENLNKISLGSWIKTTFSWRMKNQLDVTCYFFHLLCAQHVSDINISIFRSLRLCWWITTSVVLFSGWSSASTCKTNTTKYQPQQKLQHTTNWEQDDRCGNSTTQSQAPEDGYINVRNTLSA